MSRGKRQREKRRLLRESGQLEAEEKAKLEAQALKEAKIELRKEKQEAKKLAAADKKARTVKPPKKKPKIDAEEQQFDEMVDTYRASFSNTVEKLANAAAKESSTGKKKRWFEE